MSNYVVTDTELTSIANAVREKTGKSTVISFPSGYVSEIESIETGGGAPSGTKEISISQNGTTTEDVSNFASAEITVNVPSENNFYRLIGGASAKTTPVSARFVGNTLPTGNAFGSYGMFWIQPGLTVYLPAGITKIPAQHFMNVCSNYGNFNVISDDSFATVTELGAECFRGSGLVGDYTFQNVTVFSGSAGAQFMKCTSLTGIHFPKMTTAPNAFSGCSGLTAMEFGSVGYPVTEWNTGNTVKATGSITAFTDVEHIDSIYAAIRAKNASCTVTVKASEAMTYNGTAYAAGDVVITDTPS